MTTKDQTQTVDTAPAGDTAATGPVPSVDSTGADANETPAEAPEEREAPLGAEAAKYRRRLRDAEVERDGLAARVDRMRTAEVTRLAADVLAQPGDLLAFGLTVADLVDEAGDVDPGKVQAAVTELLASRPGLGKVAQSNRDFRQGTRQSAAGAPGWSDLLRGR